MNCIIHLIAAGKRDNENTENTAKISIGWHAEARFCNSKNNESNYVMCNNGYQGETQYTLVRSAKD
jgi:hypothetical protein